MTIGYIAVSVLQIIIYTVYIKEMLGLKRRGMWLVICWIFTEAINYINETYINTALSNSLIYLLIFMGIAAFIGKGKLLKKLIMAVIFIVLSTVTELLVVGIVIMTGVFDMNDIQSNAALSNILLLLVQMIIFIGIQIVSHVWRRKGEYETDLKHSAWVLCNSLGCFVAMAVVAVNMVKANDFSIEQIIVLCILISVNFISYYFYNVSVENNRIKIESEVYRKQVEFYNEWYEGIKLAREEARSVRHDMNNHFGAIKAMAESERPDRDKSGDIVKYIDSLNLNYNAEHTTDSGNTLIDAMIDMKKSYAKAQDIDMAAELLIPRNMRYNEPDFVIVFGNLIDNAIEACMRNGGKVENKIFTKIKHDRGNIFISVKNTYDGSLDGQSGDISENLIIETSKRDKRRHGLGLSNVARIVGKYDGEVKWKTKDKHFIVNVLMYGFKLD